MSRQQANAPRGETFIALRARREAYHIATDILYEEPIDVRTVICRGCGDMMNVSGPTVTDPLTCPACGVRTPLPTYIRAKYVPRAMRQIDTSPIECAGSEPIGRDACDVPWYATDVPRWMWWFSIILLVVGTIVAAVVVRIQMNY